MTTFLKIQDKIEEISKGEIQKRRLSPIFAILLIVLSLPLLWFGGRNAFLGLDSTYILSVLGAILGLAGLILLLLPREYFVLAAARGVIKPHTINLNPNEKERILDLYEKGQIKEIFRLSTKSPSPLSIELWVKDGHKNVYTQLYQSIDSFKRPISLVRVFPIEEIKR